MFNIFFVSIYKNPKDEMPEYVVCIFDPTGMLLAYVLKNPDGLVGYELDVSPEGVFTFKRFDLNEYPEFRLMVKDLIENHSNKTDGI